MGTHGTQGRSDLEARRTEAGFPEAPLCVRLDHLDRASLDLVAGETDRVCISIGSHNDALARRVEAGSEPPRTEERIRSAVELCGECGIALEVEVPFAAENAVVLPRTVAWLAGLGVERVRIVPHPPRSCAADEVDAFACFSAAYIERTRAMTADAAEQSGVELIWEPREG